MYEAKDWRGCRLYCFVLLYYHYLLIRMMYLIEKKCYTLYQSCLEGAWPLNLLLIWHGWIVGKGPKWTPKLDPERYGPARHGKWRRCVTSRVTSASKPSATSRYRISEAPSRLDITPLRAYFFLLYAAVKTVTCCYEYAFRGWCFHASRWKAHRFDWWGCRVDGYRERCFTSTTYLNLNFTSCSHRSRATHWVSKFCSPFMYRFTSWHVIASS